MSTGSHSTGHWGLVQLNASSVHLRVGVQGGFVIVEIVDDGRDPDRAAMVTVLAEYRGVLSQSNTRDGGTHLTWTASVH